MLDPIRRFMSGGLKGLYDEARSFVRDQESNFGYLESDDSEQILSILNDPDCFNNDGMQKVKTLVERLKEQIQNCLQTEKESAWGAVEALQQRVIGMDEYQALTSDQRVSVDQTFEELSRELGSQRWIAVIRDTARRFEETEYPRLLQEIQSDTRGGEGDDPKPGKIVQRRSIPVTCDKALLTSATDVNEYVDAVKEALMKEIERGNRVQI